MAMRGPSAQASALLHERLVAAVGQVGSRKTAQVGDDLLGLAEVLRTTPSLRRVVTDLLGHDAAAMDHPVHRELLARAARWLTEAERTEP